MSGMKLATIESRFDDIIWQNEPLTPGELVKFAEKELTWKWATTYTILKRLCDGGIFQKKDRVITSLISCAQFYALQSEKFVEEAFEGSLPAFLLPSVPERNCREKRSMS